MLVFLLSLVFEKTEHDYCQDLRGLVRPTREHVWSSANMLFRRACYRTYVRQHAFRLFHRLPGSGRTFCLVRTFPPKPRCYPAFDAREGRPCAVLDVVTFATLRSSTETSKTQLSGPQTLGSAQMRCCTKHIGA